MANDYQARTLDRIQEWRWVQARNLASLAKIKTAADLRNLIKATLATGTKNARLEVR
jgi:hypothetical protein